MEYKLGMSLYERNVLMHVIITLKSLSIPFILFSFFLVYFVFIKGWYDPAQLVIRGNASGGNGSLEVSWDSGAGYNTYESRQFLLRSFGSEEQDKHELVIQRLDEKNPASLSKDVFVSKITVDNKVLDLSQIAQQLGFKFEDSSLRISEGKAVLVLEVKAKESINVDMLTNNSSGIVTVGVNCVSQQKDLYAANEKSTHVSFDHWIIGKSGEFVVRMALPRYLIQKIRVKNSEEKDQLKILFIAIETVEKTVTLLSGGKDQLNSVNLLGRSDLQKRYFKISQFIQQTVFAFLTTWIVLALLRFLKACGGISGVFSGKRQVFWFFLGGALATYSSWVFIF